MNFHLNKLIKLIKKYNVILSFSLSLLLTISLFFSFIYFISKTKDNPLTPYSQPRTNQEQVMNMGNFTTDSTDEIESKITSYFNDFFSARNQSFLTGNVEKMYSFYDLGYSPSKCSINHEFERISYLRDWANERGIDFLNISSTPYIMNVKTTNNIIKLDVNEIFNICYVYKDNPSIKKNFSITLFHNNELQIIGNGFSIHKDYYFDCFENTFKKYNFNLTEKELPITSFRLYHLNCFN